MARGWKVNGSVRMGYECRNNKYRSLVVSIYPYQSGTFVRVGIENSVIAETFVNDTDLLEDEDVLQNLLDDVSDITSKLMKSFDKIMSWSDRYSPGQFAFFLLSNDEDSNIRNFKRELAKLPDKFDELFY